MHPSNTKSHDRTLPAGGGWSRQALVSFGVILLALTAVGLYSLLHRPRIPSGLPADPELAEAREALGGRFDVDAGDLRFESSLGVSASVLSAGSRPDSMGTSRLEKARRYLEIASARNPRDPRFDCLFGHLELAGGGLEQAARRYRSALAFAPRYGEARLGLGVALARQAAHATDEPEARGLTLQAIAQLAAVDEGDRFHLPALYDRALLLGRVSREPEARRWAARYAELDPGSDWAEKLRQAVGME